MEKLVNIPAPCVTLDPLHSTPVKLKISDIVELQSLLGTRSLFLYKNHSVTAVDVIGFVTSLKVKYDSFDCNIDDGTGSIQCYCSFDSDLQTKNPSASRTKSKFLQRRLQRRPRTISLGDFLQVRGNVKLNAWKNNKYISNCSWKALDQPNADEVWLEFLREQAVLYKEVYDRPFSVNVNLKKAAKSFATREMRRNCYSVFEPFVYKLIKTPGDLSEFFGYEVLELKDIKQSIPNCFSTESNGVDFTNQEKNVITFTVVADLLHKYVVSGDLIKKKCLSQEAVTNIDQINARYYLTALCEPVLKKVRDITKKLIEDHKPADVYNILSSFDEPNFCFLRNSKYGAAVITAALRSIDFNKDFAKVSI